MKMPIECPHCKTEFVSVEDRKKLLGWIDHELDRLTKWQCLVCNKCWDRQKK